MRYLKLETALRVLTATAVFAGLLTLLVGAAQAIPFTVTNTYTNANTNFTDTVTAVARFDINGPLGPGTQKVQVEEIEFTFSKRGFTQAPIVNLGPPDINGIFPQGTFLAIFEDGLFEFLVSEGGAGGFAQPPAEIRPAGGIVKVFVFLGELGLTERIEFSSSIGRYDLVTQDVSFPSNAVPEPALLPLLAVGLIGLVVSRRRGV